MDWTFGLSPNEIEMTSLGFAVQTSFFEEIFKNDSFLGDMTLGFGLIGFTIIILTLGRLPASQVLSWAILFLILIVRPIADPLFFTFLDQDNAPQLYETPCQGGTMTQEECHAATGNIEGRPTYQDRLNAKGYPQITAFTPQLAAVSALNNINYGLANQFLQPGNRMLAGYQPAIEAIKRGRTSSDSTNFNISQFLAVCATAEDGSALGLAAGYVPFAQLEDQGSRDVISALKNRKIKAWDAWQLFLQYDAYAQAHKDTPISRLLLPPLVCPPDGCQGEGAWDVKDTSVGEEYRVPAVLKWITANGSEDFIRVRDNRRNVHRDTLGLMSRLNMSVIDDTQRRMREQPVSLAMPLNANAIAAGMSFESAESGADNGTNIGPIVNAIGTTVGAGGGCAAGALAGGAAGSVVPFLGNIAGAILGCIAGGVGGALVADAVIPEVMRVNIPIVDGSGSARAPEPERVYVVENCADFHRLTDARLFVDTALSNRLADTFADVLKDGRLPNDFSKMSPQDQATVALHAALTAQLKSCDEGFYIFSSAEECRKEAEKNIGELVKYAQTMAVNNTLPSILASSQIKAGSTPQMIGDLRNLMVGAGSVFAPIGIDIKAIWGGFEAGTYATIMPFIVSFGTALTIMITPFLYAIGLLVPMWSLSILLIPIVGVVYFQLVKVVFTVINIMGNTMLDAHDLGLLTGTHAKLSDIIMSTAYTMAFILSAGLLFALRNPAAIIQNVAGKADGMSQISLEEAIGSAYLAKNALGFAANAVSGKSWGALVGQIRNQAAGRGGFSDQFHAAQLETLQDADNLRARSYQARVTPLESEEALGYRGTAAAMEDIGKRADAADKGALLAGKYRVGRRVAAEGPNGTRTYENRDSAVVALAESLGKEPPQYGTNRDVARVLINHKYVNMTQHSDGTQYLQLDVQKIRNARDIRVHKAYEQLLAAGKVDSVRDDDAQTVLDNVIKGAKL